ncbi:MAG: hypothetical protein AAFY76_15355 [Cyanobacteria bacterium J06649_11]
MMALKMSLRSLPESFLARAVEYLLPYGQSKSRSFLERYFWERKAK